MIFDCCTVFLMEYDFKKLNLITSFIYFMISRCPIKTIFCLVVTENKSSVSFSKCNHFHLVKLKCARYDSASFYFCNLVLKGTGTVLGL